METRPTLEGQIEGLAVLAEPARRGLYLYVARRQQDVGRDEAAKAVGVSRSLAGFHLDRLVEEGLLEASFRRLSGRTGPGAGRPAKVYRRSRRQLDLSVPQRSYELAARILATAVDTSAARDTRGALKKSARRIGAQIGGETRSQAGPRPGRKRLIAGMVDALASQGYEPAATPGAVRFRNCPFDALVGEHRELVCGMNLALIEGVVQGIDLPGVRPVLAPEPGMCCVRLEVPKR